jgi:hypothetical protein
MCQFLMINLSDLDYLIDLIRAKNLFNGENHPYKSKVVKSVSKSRTIISRFKNAALNNKIIYFFKSNVQSYIKSYIDTITTRVTNLSHACISFHKSLNEFNKDYFYKLVYNFIMHLSKSSSF